LKDPNFLNSLPPNLQPDVQKYLQNPSCGCNMGFYNKIMQEAVEQVASYFPTKILVPPQEQVEKLAKNSWIVINCSIGEIEARLKALPAGRKQITVARYEDQATVIINELDVVF
jgi:hypothetical protein